MILNDDLFKAQIRKLDAGKINTVHWKYTATFIDENNNKIPIINVTALNKQAKYITAISDYFFITVQVLKSDYLKLINTNRRKLRVELIRTPTSITGSNANSQSGGIVDLYSAYLTDNTSEAVETRHGGLLGDHRDDLGEIVELNIHLIERGLVEFRLWEVGGVYRNIRTGDLIRGLLSQPIKALGESETINYNVTLSPPDNTEINFQLTVPNGIRIIDFPGWLQKKQGVYSSGLGYYLNQGMWYVYPLYDIDRYNKVTKRMTIINIPRNEMIGITNSYNVEGDEIFIYATGDSKHIDTIDRLLDDTGTGFKSAIMGNLLDKHINNEAGQTTAPVNKALTVSFDSRNGEMENIKAVPGLFSSNPWQDASVAISKLINTVVLQWESSNPYIVYPGMPIKFIYKFRGIPYALFGVLSGIDTTINTNLQSTTDNRYIMNSILTISCAKVDNSNSIVF